MNINNNFRQKSSNKLVNPLLLHLYNLWQDFSVATLPTPHRNTLPAVYPFILILCQINPNYTRPNIG